MAEFVRVRSVDAPGEYLVAQSVFDSDPSRYVIVDEVSPVIVPEVEPERVVPSD